MVRILAFVGIVVALVTVAAACGGDGEETAPVRVATATSTPTPTSTPVPSTQPTPTATPTPAGTTEAGTPDNPIVLEVLLTGTLPQGTNDSYRFEPSDFTFEAGKTYKIIATATSQFHTFTVTDLGINIQVLPNQTVERTVTIPDTPGNFQLICIPHQSLGMVGTIDVK